MKANRPKTVFALVRIDEDPVEAYVDLFESEHLTRVTTIPGGAVSMVLDKPATESALRAAIKEFLATKEGKAAVENENGNFNFGDAVSYIPDVIWARHGLKHLSDPAETAITVSQNESFVD
jgi:hypothetical protein